MFANPSILPPPLQNDLGQRALDGLGIRLSQLDINQVLVNYVDGVDARLLPILAEQWRVLGDAGWELADTDAKKRALIKNALALHRTKGTRFAIERALELLGVVADITEWWEAQPPAAPYTFLVEMNVSRQPVGAPVLDGARMAQITKVINYWKNVRSHGVLQVGMGGATSLAWAGVGGFTTLLNSAGQLLPFDVAGASRLANAGGGIGGGIHLLVGASTIQ